MSFTYGEESKEEGTVSERGGGGDGDTFGAAILTTK